MFAVDSNKVQDAGCRTFQLYECMTELQEQSTVLKQIFFLEVVHFRLHYSLIIVSIFRFSFLILDSHVSGTNCLIAQVALSLQPSIGKACWIFFC